MDTLLSSKEAAAFIGISDERLSELVKTRVVPAYTIAGEFLRFKKEELEALKDLLQEAAETEEGRVFNKKFVKMDGIDRVKEILRANDLYRVAFAVVIIALFVYFKK